MFLAVLELARLNAGAHPPGSAKRRRSCSSGPPASWAPRSWRRFPDERPAPEIEAALEAILFVTQRAGARDRLLAVFEADRARRERRQRWCDCATRYARGDTARIGIGRGRRRSATGDPARAPRLPATVLRGRRAATGSRWRVSRRWRSSRTVSRSPGPRSRSLRGKIVGRRDPESPRASSDPHHRSQGGRRAPVPLRDHPRVPHALRSAQLSRSCRRSRSSRRRSERARRAPRRARRAARDEEARLAQQEPESSRRRRGGRAGETPDSEPKRYPRPTSGMICDRQRLQKILARAGIAARRKVEELILEGRVTVNGGWRVRRQGRSRT